MRNLLAWSEDFSQDSWSKTGAMAIDPLPSSWDGVKQTTHILNLAGSECTLRQAVGCSPAFPYSISVNARSSSSGKIGLAIGGQRRDFVLSTQWQTCHFSAIPGGAADQVLFAIAIPIGGDIELAGICAEFGSTCPEYKTSEGRQGLYSYARFKQDLLIVSSSERGSFSAETTIIAKVGE